MALSQTQIEKIYQGLPNSLGGIILSRPRGRQFLNSLPYPRLVFSIISQGVPVSESRLLTEYYASSIGLRTEVWSQNMKARISLILQSQDPEQADILLNALITDLNASELGINPINDYMQFRGADPPSALPPYTDPDNKKLVQGHSIDIFVEYMITWKKYFDVIKEVYVEYDTRIGNDIKTGVWYDSEGNDAVNYASFYSLDVIIIS